MCWELAPIPFQVSISNQTGFNHILVSCHYHGHTAFCPYQPKMFIKHWDIQKWKNIQVLKVTYEKHLQFWQVDSSTIIQGARISPLSLDNLLIIPLCLSIQYSPWPLCCLIQVLLLKSPYILLWDRRLSFFPAEWVFSFPAHDLLK